MPAYMPDEPEASQVQLPANPSTRVPSTVWGARWRLPRQPRTRDNTRNIARGRSRRDLEAVTIRLLRGIKSRRGLPGLAARGWPLFAPEPETFACSCSDGKFRSPLPCSALFFTRDSTRPAWDYSTLS